jgi:hypothetical protein
MAHQYHNMAFLVAARTALGLLFSLAALISTHSYAAYADCLATPDTDTRVDCFSIQTHTGAVANNDGYFDATVVAASIATATTPAAPAASPGFYVAQPHSGDERQPESLPIMLLLAALVTVWLVRAKNVNNK